LDWTWRANIYNVEIAKFYVGFNGTGGLFSNIYNLNVHDNYVGVWLGLKYGNYHFYGGSIQYNQIGLELFSDAVVNSIDQSTDMNQFYGTEIELNTIADVNFNAGIGIVAGNIFEGCYFERAPSMTQDFFTYNNGANVRANSFIGCKFASQINSQLQLQGVGHVFFGNWFDGPSNFTVTGSNHTITDNKAIATTTEVVFTDKSFNSTINNNSFDEAISVAPIETPTASPTPQMIAIQGNVNYSTFPTWNAIGSISTSFLILAGGFLVLRGKNKEFFKKIKMNEQEVNK
jgi:hypothetical protein